MFVYRARPGTTTTAAPRYAAVPVLDALKEEYASRPSWPKTPDDFMQVSPTPEQRTFAEAREAGEGGIFTQDTATTRLRLVDLNSVSARTFSDGDLNALIPTEAVNLTLGTAWNDRKAVIMRMNAAESYALSLERLIPLVLRTSADADAERYVLQDAYRDHLALLAQPGEQTVWIQVVSEVLYVRGVDMSIQARRGSRPDDELHLSELEGELEVEPSPVEDAPPVVEDPELDPAYGAFRRAQAINSILIESDMDDVPGGFVRFLSVTDESVSLRRIWHRGLAVAVRAMTFEVDVDTGHVRTIFPPRD
jgi:hypothetical protein